MVKNLQSENKLDKRETKLLKVWEEVRGVGFDRAMCLQYFRSESPSTWKLFDFSMGSFLRLMQEKDEWLEQRADNGAVMIDVDLDEKGELVASVWGYPMRDNGIKSLVDRFREALERDGWRLDVPQEESKK